MMPTFSVCLVGIFIGYITYTLWTFYVMFYPTACQQGCIYSFLKNNPNLELHVFTSLTEKSSSRNEKIIWHIENFQYNSEFERSFNITLPSPTRNNGSLYVHVYVTPPGLNPHSSHNSIHISSRLTHYITEQKLAINLIGTNEENKTKIHSDKPITHWYSSLLINVLNDPIPFDRLSFPQDIAHRTRLSTEHTYLPVVHIDKLNNRLQDLTPVTPDSFEMPLLIKYKPISCGKLRLWINMEESFNQLQALGFTDKDIDEVKGLFSDTNHYLLLLTFIVSAFHLLFDFLAFKNDIKYWKNRDSMVGLSSGVVVWRGVSTCIIFLYLLDENTSMLILIPAGIGTLIELWKVTKAFKMKLSWNGIKPNLTFGSSTIDEIQTSSFDAIAMRYLSYVLYPLCFIGAGYSLFYTPHKSWYSWCIQSLVNGVYAFGFLFMMPQLFVNYKLKSVAHLPWRAFMYKAFNTFIDDIFAFIITMPTAHRLACFRDDLIFVVYLYQRWLYPVDKTRINEYGQTFDSPDNESKKKK